mmetsp:Transcript_35307/g.82435  ORF Transcript_35307/g.82435 Transcript_35307/m.82435 type:complete len:547 (+) Transcript_35307:93-1733(+)
MAEYHSGTDVEIADGIATSAFRVAIPNPERYRKANNVSLEDVATACREGDYTFLERMIASGNATQLFNGDLNGHFNKLTPLHYAALTGNTECIELLLQAKADPHMKESVAFGKDPEDGRTALACARQLGWQDAADMLAKAEKQVPYGSYVPAGPDANVKIYNAFEWGSKPDVGWYFKRPGAAKAQGLDPAKFGIVETPGSHIVAPQAKARVTKPAVAEDGARKPPLTQPSLPLALLFPGQGSQYVGMLGDVKDLAPVKAMLEKAHTILGYDILQLCLKGPESELGQTKYCQPALFIGGLAALEKLKLERPEAALRPQATAGLSLGEYTALCAAGVFSFEDGLELVKLRGEAMQEAAEAKPQKMLSVAGLERNVLEKCCKQVLSKAGPGACCQIANELFPGGFAVGGGEAEIAALNTLVTDAGALQAKVLKTGGAFHTPFMAPAAEKLNTKLQETLPKMKPPSCAVYMNASASAVAPGADPARIVELLKKQLTSPVLWQASVERMLKDRVTEFYELGPMKQLKAMMKRIDPAVWGKTTNIDVGTPVS